MIVSDQSSGLETWPFSLLFVLGIAGYPLAALGSTITGIDNIYFSASFRAIVGLLAVLTIWAWIRRRYPTTSDLTISLFFMLYIFRLAYDSMIAEVPDANFAFLMFIATCAVPGIALGLVAPQLSEKRTAVYLLIVGALTSAGALYAGALGLNEGAVGYQQSDRLAFESLNPITLGYSGIYTILAAIICWRHITGKMRAVFIVAAILGGAGLLSSGSRGPALALAATLAALAILNGRWLYLISVFGGAGAYLFWFSSGAEQSFIDRFSGVGTDTSSFERLDVQAVAIEDFLAHPFMGNAYVDSIFLSYPHNLLLESGMALGGIGLALMIVIMFKIIRATKNGLRSGAMLFPLMMISGLVNAMLSGNLWASADFWLPAMIVIGLNRSAWMRLGQSKAIVSGPSHNVALHGI